jgi:hyperosmotically inducible protein
MFILKENPMRFSVACLQTLLSTVVFGASAHAIEDTVTSAGQGVSVQPNNSAINKRDASATEVTAQDQGSSKRDIRLTRNIRKAVMKLKDFSADAKNVKIISINGVVTLKGPVKSLTEKNEIERIAKRIAGADKVENQLETLQ